MAKILSFEQRLPPVGRAHVATGLPAIVVIFPGVRYERTIEAEPVDGKGSGGTDSGKPSGTVQ
ncbi:MAG: hypothetical protein JNL61_05365 [Rhizobiaceae bacterium]|nr:hypothetical protein [Rhizobiaceae bacterium]